MGNSITGTDNYLVNFVLISMYSTPLLFFIPLLIWIDSLNYMLMSSVYLGLTIYFSLGNKEFIDLSITNYANYFFVLWFSMPLQLFLALFAETLLVPLFLLGLIGVLFILAFLIFYLILLKSVGIIG